MIETVVGNTGYIPGAVNIGVYAHDNGKCTIVDTGLDDRSAKTVLKALKKEGMHLKRIIISHAHADHTGGAAILQKETHAEIYATRWEAAIAENPMLEPFYLFSAKPLKSLQTKFFLAQPCRDVTVIDPDAQLDGLMMSDLAGHSLGQIGVRTADNVFMVADAFFPESVLDKYYIPYLADIEQAKKTLQKLQGESAAYYLPAHGSLSQDIDAVLQANLTRLIAIEDDILRYLAQGRRTREEIISCFAREQDIQLDTGQYFLIAATVAAYLAYLNDMGKIQQVFADGFLTWTREI